MARLEQLRQDLVVLGDGGPRTRQAIFCDLRYFEHFMRLAFGERYTIVENGDGIVVGQIYARCPWCDFFIFFTCHGLSKNGFGFARVYKINNAIMEAQIHYYG